MKVFTVFVIVTLLSIASIASASYHCPCKCIVTYGKPLSFARKLAKRQCLQHKYHGCIVEGCKKHHRRGFWCCNPPKPTTTATATATPTPTPSMSATPSTTPKPVCPCICRKGYRGKNLARKECRKLAPYCKVEKCEVDYHKGFSCCH